MHVNYTVSHDEPGTSVQHYLEPLLVCLAEDLNDIVSTLTPADKAWFLSSVEEIWSRTLSFDDEL